ncbi:MAG: methyltransferase domain-containing protein [Chitinophagaceae bacterium]|nr:methyltransferase domain-containing protein [Chitinophagaceae bacterium]MCW5904897.1 methyltransferase domain-containing protein [Chitinophagaceae bacterium]
MKKNCLGDLISPVTKQKSLQVTENEIIFSENEKYIIANGIPIIINEQEGLFSVSSIVSNVETTQQYSYNDIKNFKTYFRRKILPSLTNDKYFDERYTDLTAINPTKVLVLGSGQKVNFYKTLFPNSIVVTSDVHCLFSPDIVFDAHSIPYADKTFDLIIAGQVLEHTMKPWIVAEEMQRVIKLEGYIHIETPVNFPYHAHPYDFYRFTYTGLRSLFNKCSVYKSFITEGNASAAAVLNSEFVINLFSNKYLRAGALFAARFLFGWMKYFDTDNKDNIKNLRRLASPKGIGITFKYDGIQRTDKELLNEYYSIKK